MARRYRVIHQKKSLVEALFSGRTYTDWYVAQCWRVLAWTKIGIYPTRVEAEAACEHHADGTLIRGNSRIVSEFERKD
ncbi:hypothetical protein [Sphingomonas montana]|uniref:hypothetical protein n=1 Tax=Sphingomonas montana TaxID=1843236 RepID=UPI00096F5E1D|nr:hypothetical protein [Sphingomonas montana]